MKSHYDVEVAVAFTDRTWLTVVTSVEDFPFHMVEEVAEEKVLEDFDSCEKTVSFVKVIWIDPKEEEG